jgi:hypothetical protein
MIDISKRDVQMDKNAFSPRMKLRQYFSSLHLRDVC